MFKKSPWRSLFTLLLTLISILFISGCANLLPTESIPATPTITITTTPTPTIDWFPATPTTTLMAIASPTPQPTRAGQMIGLTNLLVEDNFSDQSLWETRQSESGNIAYGNQNLTLAVAKQSASLFSLSQHTLPENFAAEITVQVSLCQPEDQIGIIFWHRSNSDFYRLLINCSGHYRLELIQAGQNVVLYDWEPATQMQLAVPWTNRFGLRADRGHFQLYINDRVQFEEQLAEDVVGVLGVFARTISAKAMTVRFSDLQIYQVESN